VTSSLNTTTRPSIKRGNPLSRQASSGFQIFHRKERQMDYVPCSELIQLSPHDCPKYKSCNAPICPLDPGCFNRIYLKGEPMCFYMMEAQKPKARCRLKGVMEGEIYRAICIVIEPLKCTYGPLRKRLQRAKHTPSRRLH
jgi:hypothetical protein